MQPVEKKKRRAHKGARALLVLALLAVALLVFSVERTMRATPKEIVSEGPTYGEMMAHEREEVASVSVRLRSGESWTIRQQDGQWSMADDPAFLVDEAMAETLLDATWVIAYTDVLTEDPSQYTDRLAEFGLDTPRSVARIAYTDGQSITLRIGDRSNDLDSAYYYMTVDGDDRLFALDITSADALTLEKQLLHKVEQPVLHKARIDRIEMEAGDERFAWTLEGEITDADAEDRWFLTEPARYPADGETMSRLRENLSNLRLGAYEGEATPERLAACGLAQPRFTLTVHQAAGRVGMADENGVWNAVDWPESTFTLAIGDAKTDNVDWVLVDGSIYVTSHFSLAVLTDLSAQSTLTRYPVLVSLSNLRRLNVETPEGTTVYDVAREAQMNEDDQAATDENGQALYDCTVQKDGKAFPWASFEAAYNRLLIATVSGDLPQGWETEEPPHTRYTFETVTGVTHTLALYRYDAMHDAVSVDGCAMFYIIRGGLDFAPEA